MSVSFDRWRAAQRRQFEADQRHRATVGIAVLAGLALGLMAGSVDGLGVARALYQRKPDLPVLLVTGYSDAASPVAGEFTVLRKPFQMAELSRTVARMIADRGQPTAPNVVRLRDMKPTPGRDKT